MLQKRISRRDFLKLSSVSLLSTLLKDLKLTTNMVFPPTQGRVLATDLFIRDSPTFTGKKLSVVKRDILLDIEDMVLGGSQGDYNRHWYRLTDQNYVYSGWIQLVKSTLNPFVEDLPDTGVLGEITVPIVETYYGINSSPSPGPRLYYATTHWITGKVSDKRDGSIWYRAQDTATMANYYIRPQFVHLIPPEEVAPLSPLVPGDQKHIEIFLDQQLLLAFEWDVLVYTARVATGRKNFESPTGWFHTFHKRPTYHMFGGADEFSIFDLPGVPWDSYITDTGVALHGTYWHNDFGTPHSHGCINMSIEDAKWIYRWTQPSVPSNEHLLLKPGIGTCVRITKN
jgi:hypothetical protein